MGFNLIFMRFRQRLVLKYIRAKFGLLSALSKRKAAEKAFQLFCTPQNRIRKKLPRVFAQAEKVQFSFQGNTVRGYRWNHPADKKALIIHGFESSVVNFDRYIKPLVKKGYEVLAFDAPAHGRSTGRQINIKIYKELIIYVYKHYGPIDGFIAHSLGGLALSLALEELQPGENCKVVFVSPATETTTAIDSFFRMLQLNHMVRKEFDKVIIELGNHPPEWYSVKRAAGNIQAQVLWVHDRDDELTPFSDVEPVVQKKYPNFQFYISEGLGHRRIYRDNKVFKAIIDFL